MNPPAGGCVARFARSAVAALILVTALAPTATATTEECVETVAVYDPYGLVSDSDITVDFSTLIDVEGLVNDYTSKIDDASDAEVEGLDPPDEMSSDDLIDEGRQEVDDAIDLGRSIAGCED
ncbi:MAG: hypothetical protein JWR11_605 [Mycobacterium sp.]|jgi:hypothetical protein|nr:hypothetical protein [Mycobacterium sp.]